ncbi:VOC family protein [Aeromicrobium sp. CF4.19]|uniref:VOC family protein n=1 Tax=Aeromicrobium sp. CF4.19 TaxID=3373082 RepID=UPI003EE49E9F
MSTITPIIETADIERLADFYREAFGATESQRVPEEGDTFFVNLTIGAATLGIVRAAGEDGSYSGPPDASRMAPAGRILLDLSVPDVDEALRAVASAGGDAPDAATDMPWGLRVGHVSDVDGNPLNLSAPTA